MKHPAEYFIKYLLIKDPSCSNDEVLKALTDWGFLTPDQDFIGFTRMKINEKPPPDGFNPLNQMHRPSMKYLRDHGVYDLFFTSPAVEEAWNILSNPIARMEMEQVLLARLELKSTIKKINEKNNWFLTVAGVTAFNHFFWNVKLLTFDEWGRFLYGRSALYERYMTMLQAPQELAFFHLRITQHVEAKNMLSRALEINYFNLEEVNQKPGTGQDKIKAIAVLTKGLVDCHSALSTSDMAMREVLSQFEKFRMEHPIEKSQNIHMLAPKGNYSGSGAINREEEEVLIK